MRDAYLDRAHLEMLLTYIDKPSGTLEEGALETCVTKLLVTARSEGWLHDLARQALTVPDNVGECLFFRRG
jgi:hypothetical protein